MYLYQQLFLSLDFAIFRRSDPFRLSKYSQKIFKATHNPSQFLDGTSFTSGASVGLGSSSVGGSTTIGASVGTGITVVVGTGAGAGSSPTSLKHW
jgi:hypothetical protein